MFSKYGFYSLIDKIVHEMMSDFYINDDVETIRKKLKELEDEYVFRVHMENGMEEHSDLDSKISGMKYILKRLKKEMEEEYLDTLNHMEQDKTMIGNGIEPDYEYHMAVVSKTR